MTQNSKYGPWPHEDTHQWKLMAAQAMREASEDLDRLPRKNLDAGNPNHPMHDGIFGYDRREFMARQYAECAK